MGDMSDTRERDTKRSRRQQGWIGAVAALLGLVLLGFLGGAVIGFLWEEPRLVFAYLSGETESVEWSEPVPAPGPELDPGDVAAAPPGALAPEGDESAPTAPAAKPAPPKPAATAAKPVPAAKPAPAPVAKPAPAPPAAPAPKQTAALPGGRFAVQVGAFAESASAEGLVERLQGRGYSAYVSPAPSGAARWRVRVGPLPTRPEAEKLAEKLQRAEDLSTWVLDEKAS